MKAKKDVKGLIKALKYSKEQSLRHDAAEALGEVGDARAIEPLVETMKDRDKLLGSKAARALGKIRDARAVEPLIEALKSKDFMDDIVGAQAAAALGEIGDPRVVEPLGQALRDEWSDVKRSAAWALDKLGWEPRDDAEKADYLLAKDEWDDLVRLGELAVEPLIRALKQGPGYQVPGRGKGSWRIGRRKGNTTPDGSFGERVWGCEG